MQRQQETDTFMAESSNGNSCVIVEYTTIVPFTKSAVEEAWAPGGQTYATLAGRPMSRISDTEFKDISSGEIFRRVPDDQA